MSIREISLTWAIEAVPGRALSGRRTSAVFGGIIGGIIGLSTGILELARVLRLHATSILELFPLLAPAARPAALQSREESMGALSHRHRAVMPMMPMMMDDVGLARYITPPRRRAVRNLVVPELRGAFRELTAPVQVQSGSFLGASVTYKLKCNSRSNCDIESGSKVLLVVTNFSCRQRKDLNEQGTP